jgi:hypothetical protein
LGSAQYRRQRLHGGPHHVVKRLTRLQCDTAGLSVEPEPAGHIIGVEPLAHEAGPETSGSPKLGGLLEQVAVGRKEK